MKKSKALLSAEAQIAKLNTEVDRLRHIIDTQHGFREQQDRELNRYKLNHKILLTNQKTLLTNLLDTDQMLGIQTQALDVYRKETLRIANEQLKKIEDNHETDQYTLAK